LCSSHIEHYQCDEIKKDEMAVKCCKHGLCEKLTQNEIKEEEMAVKCCKHGLFEKLTQNFSLKIWREGNVNLGNKWCVSVWTRFKGHDSIKKQTLGSTKSREFPDWLCNSHQRFCYMVVRDFCDNHDSSAFWSVFLTYFLLS
jgi:hypothetical protein